jgi:phosphoglycerol transferase MdoB-like AlkP superfamily enzyme
MYFPKTNTFDLLRNCFYGLRFDSFSIAVSNSLFIFLSILPFNFFFRETYQRLLKWVFIVSNAIFISTNFIDVSYFAFTRKRSTYDLLEQIGGQSDLARLIPQFLADFWLILLLYIALVVLIVIFYERIKISEARQYKFSKTKDRILVALLFLLTSGITVLSVRGGFQRVPIDIVNAGAVAPSDEIPIVLNTPFTLIKSANQQALKEYHFFEENDLKKIYSPLHHFKDSTFKKQNVVVIILESFSKEYTQLGRIKSITPFLDSLMGKSLVFTNAFSNGSRSIEGIPAILSGLPSLMENPFINSIYATNQQTSLASILKKEGYETAFLHGGINGTMNFDDWAPAAGYQFYFGRNEYNNDEDFDNFWGIWDEPFLQYSVRKMNAFKQPFHTAIFTLSSHHPYFVPVKHKNKFPKGDLENTESIEYADYALQQFFASAKKTNWYNNTLFVLTADHASISDQPFFSNVVGNQSIPILFFKPDNSLIGSYNNTFSHMDVLPSVLELMGYKKPFFAFGQSYLSSKNTHAFYYGNGTHYLYNDSMVFSFSNNKMTTAFNYKKDSTLTNNIIFSYPALDSIATLQFKSFIQTYNHTLINNTARTE